MKDTNDTTTLALIPEPKKRGRPVTGKALSVAERQARYRQARRIDSVTVTFNRADIPALKMLIQVSDVMAAGTSEEVRDRVLQAVVDSALKQPPPKKTKKPAPKVKTGASRQGRGGVSG